MIIIKSNEEIEKIRKACVVTGEILRDLPEIIKPGISTKEIDDRIERYIIKSGQRPAFKGYEGFPFASCISVNEELVHGFPSKARILQEGDIVSVDTGTIYEGYYSDAARTYPVGDISEENARLIAACKASFFEGLKYCRAGNRLGDVSHAIQTCAEAEGFSVIRDLVGHGIGMNMHEDPPVPNYGRPGRGPKLAAGMVLAIEPMIAIGSFEVETAENGWTVYMKDRSFAAHYENTVVITDGEPMLPTCMDEK